MARRRIGKVLNASKLINQLRHMGNRAEKEANSVSAVSYGPEYAVYIHQNVEMKLKGVSRSVHRRGAKGVYWGQPDSPGGQSKYLEQPARDPNVHKQMLQVVRLTLRGDKKLRFSKGMLAAAIKLKIESQKLVPIETGELLRSARARLLK